MMTEQSAILKLRDVVAALEKRGRHDEAEYYSVLYPLFLSLTYDVSQDEVMDMSLDDLFELPNIPQKPLKYEGWNTFYFGRAAFADKS